MDRYCFFLLNTAFEYSTYKSRNEQDFYRIGFSLTEARKTYLNDNIKVPYAIIRQ